MNKRTGWLAYQTGPDRLHDLFPGGWLGAMAWADIVSAQSGDDRFSDVAREYRRLSFRKRSAVSLEELCDKVRIERREFTTEVIACALSSGADVFAVLNEMASRSVRLANLVAIALQPGGANIRRRLLEDWGLL